MQREPVTFVLRIWLRVDQKCLPYMHLFLHLHLLRWKILPVVCFRLHLYFYMWISFFAFQVYCIALILQNCEICWFNIQSSCLTSCFFWEWVTVSPFRGNWDSCFSKQKISKIKQPLKKHVSAVSSITDVYPQDSHFLLKVFLVQQKAEETNHNPYQNAS